MEVSGFEGHKFARKQVAERYTKEFRELSINFQYSESEWQKFPSGWGVPCRKKKFFFGFSCYFLHAPFTPFNFSVSVCNDQKNVVDPKIE